SRARSRQSTLAGEGDEVRAAEFAGEGFFSSEATPHPPRTRSALGCPLPALQMRGVEPVRPLSFTRRGEGVPTRGPHHDQRNTLAGSAWAEEARPFGPQAVGYECRADVWDGRTPRANAPSTLSHALY